MSPRLSAKMKAARGMVTAGTSCRDAAMQCGFSVGQCRVLRSWASVQGLTSPGGVARERGKVKAKPVRVKEGNAGAASDWVRKGRIERQLRAIEAQTQTAIALCDAPPFVPVGAHEWVWASTGFKLWSQDGLDRDAALRLCRAGRLGELNFGFYISHSLAERPVPIHTALWREWVTVAEARAKALTYFSNAAKGLPEGMSFAIAREPDILARRIAREALRA